MADFLLDTDVCIWHLRGQSRVVSLLQDLVARGSLGISAVTRAEVQQGVRPGEEESTLLFLEACETLPVTAFVADKAGALVRTHRSMGTTVPLPDALIASTALLNHLPLYTCNARHYPFEGFHMVAVEP